MYMHNGPKVDILMATYNGQLFLREQIDSILNQSYTNFNLIILDDKSTDGTINILKSYQNKDSRVKVRFSNENVGVIRCFERLIMLSTEDYFMLSDQDDIWHQDKVYKSINKLSNSKAILVYSDLRVISRDKDVIANSYWEYEGIQPIFGSKWKILLMQNIVTGCTIIARRRLIELALPFPHYIEMHDSWLAIVATLVGEIDYINESTIDYRQHGKNQIGIVGVAGNFTRLGESKNFKDFLKKRSLYIRSRINLLNEIERSLATYLDDEIKIDINLLKSSFSCLIRTAINNIWLKGIILKIRFPSQGLKRNVWWAILLNSPAIAYLIVRIFMVSKQRRVRIGWLRKR